MSGKVDITVVRIHAKAGSFYLPSRTFLPTWDHIDGHATTPADGAAPASALTQAAAAGRLDAVRALLAGGAPVEASRSPRLVSKLKRGCAVCRGCVP